jgi:RNA polymerase sigma factor (sigma-70 family)
MTSAPWEGCCRPRTARGRRRGAERVEQNEVAVVLRRAAEGDRASWNALVDSFSGMIWAVAHGHRLGPADAGEVVQTTWLRLLENLDRIREPERIGGWLATTARRESLRLLRLRGRELATDDDTRFDDAAPDEPGPEELLLDRDRDRRLWRAFARLSERCRRLLELVVVVRPPYAEVAAALDMPVGSIGPTRARCLNRLREALALEGEAGEAKP